MPVPLKCCPFTIVCVEPCGFSLAACCHCSCCVPGVNRMNFVKLRSRTGRSVSSFVENRVATSARSVLSSGDPPETVTDSVSCPTLRVKLTGVCVSTLICARRHHRGLEAGELGAQSRTTPGSSRSLRYTPDSLVTTVSTVLRSTLVIVTVAPGRSAPVESRTMPLTLP